MKVAHGDGEEEAPEIAQDRIPQVPVKERHCSMADAALEPVAHYHVVSATKSFHERIEPGEIVATVGIAHDHVDAARRSNSSHQCRAISLHGDVNDSCAMLLRYTNGPVAAAVVSDENFAFDPLASQELARLTDARSERLGLV
jgi:hypothetical protein